MSDLSDKEARKSFLDELKSHYAVELATQQGLDSKINTLMATSATVTGLLFGFGTFLVTKLNHEYDFLYLTIFSLVFAILANLTSFVICVIAYRIQSYYFIMRVGFIRNENRLKKDEILTLVQNKNSHREYLDRSRIEEYENMDITKFYSELIRYYIVANAFNKKNNDSKGKKIFLSQIIFLIGLILIPILLGFLLYAYSIDQILLSLIVLR